MRSRHCRWWLQMGKGWHGHASRSARAQIRPRLPLPCCRCGRLVIPDPSKPHEGWQPDHWPIPRELGGTEMWPAHSHCNMSAGGKRGAQITNEKKARRINQPRPHEHSRKIRGV